MTFPEPHWLWSHRHPPLTDDWLQAQRGLEALAAAKPPTTSTIQPVLTVGSNELRPRTLAEVIGQDAVKDILRRVIDASLRSGKPLDHMLLIGAAGTGKTTLGRAIAHELGTQVYQLEAPVTSEQLAELRTLMNERDVLIIDEVHRQVVPDRRGVSTTGGAEVLYHVLEDRMLVTSSGVEDFPAITVVACTTDSGQLPPSFLDRFPLQPRLRPYTIADMQEIALYNAHQLDIAIEPTAAMTFACAARGNPRLMNRYVRNAQSLSDGHINVATAQEVITVLNSTTLDGLDLDMQRMLTFIYLNGRREKPDGTAVYQSSVGAVATALGKSRDQKAISLYTEPTLIERGLLSIQPRGRELTPAGILRARELT